jgi:DHA1 family tetracycline resistance protein-like MFS transporter
MVCAGLTFVNFLFGLLVMPESLRPENRRAITWSQMNPVGALRAVWRYPGVAAMVPIFVAAQLAQQGLQSVWVPYTTYRYGWSVAQIGASLAVVGLLFAISQGVLVRPVVARFGELRTLTIALVVAAVGMLLFGLSSQGWMMYAVTALYCLGLGLLNPAVQGLMSRSVAANAQGLLQGAMTSVMTAAAIVGPPLANGLFALSISPQAPATLPGAPFFLGSILCLAALWLAARQFPRSKVSVYVGPKCPVVSVESDHPLRHCGIDVATARFWLRPPRVWRWSCMVGGPAGTGGVVSVVANKRAPFGDTRGPSDPHRSSPVSGGGSADADCAERPAQHVRQRCW